jgi:hypothetical protein
MKCAVLFTACLMLAGGASAQSLSTQADVARRIVAYDELLNGPGRDPAQPLSAAAQALLDNPSDLLAALERQFYELPSIETMAWFGSVAEDVAYMGVNRRTDPKTGAVNPAEPGANAWIKTARGNWRKMAGFMERGWAAGAVWPRFGAYTYESTAPAEPASWNEQLEVAMKKWFAPIKPSLLKQDTDAYFVSGEPMTKRQLIRGRAGSVQYAAEISALAVFKSVDAPRSSAGGFRSAHGFVEFLKGQPNSFPMKFVHSGSYGIDGLLGTVGVEITAPSTLPVFAVTRQGASRASSLQVTGAHQHCGPGQGVRVGFAAPLKSEPLAYLATTRGFDPARTTVRTLGMIQEETANTSTGMPPFRYAGFRVDLDGDGQPDLLIVQGRGQAELGTSGLYDGEDSLLSAVWANIGGIWKRVAMASESGCT